MALLIEANHAVSADQLLDCVWETLLRSAGRGALDISLSRLLSALVASRIVTSLASPAAILSLPTKR
jgi:DNA-binding SARP family transcriptional activator